MFAIKRIHQIEMTSRCNLRCRYCPSPNLQRPKQDMDDDTYLLALSWARRLKQAAGGQQELNLAGIGESTMHPEFVRNVYWAREAIGNDTLLILATNGLLMTDELARAIAPARPTVFVSLHRPEKAGPAIEALKRVNLLAGVSADPSIAATNWAGQVKWHSSVSARRECKWVKGGLVIVHADGNVSRCAYDANGSGVITTIRDDLSQYATSPYSLCETCDMDVGVPIAPRANVVSRVVGDNLNVRT